MRSGLYRARNVSSRLIDGMLRRLRRPKWIVLSAAVRIAMMWRIRTPGSPHTLPGELIVSLTSYSPRFPTLLHTLRSLLCQTTKADRIILWISHEDEPMLPEAVRNLTKYGLDIRVTEDIKSFKKIVPTLKAFPNAFIVTADDDVYYAPKWLEDLVSASSGETKLITCYQARRVQLSEDGELLPYEMWPNLSEPEVSAAVFPIGRGGILYPPGALSPEVLDEDAFLELCPGADDVWLYWMGRRAGSIYRRIDRSNMMWDWPGSQKVALFPGNFGDLNNQQIRAVAKRFGYPDLGR